MKTKSIIITLMGVVSGILFGACSKDEIIPIDNEKEDRTPVIPSTPTPTEEDIYYVHYSCSKYSSLHYRDADGSMAVWDYTNIALDMTIGPVKKGFEAELVGTCSLNTAKFPMARIQISKNGGPWVDKCVSVIGVLDNGNNVSLSYVIDF